MKHESDYISYSEKISAYTQFAYERATKLVLEYGE